MIKNNSLWKIINILMFALAAALLLWRIRLGAADAFVCPDEAFYLALPYRMSFGDLLFYEETNLAQLMAFITFPFMKLWLLLRGGTDGIVLSYRFIWLAVHCLNSLILFFALRRKYPRAAMFAAVCYMLSVPFNIYAMSYNTIQLMAVVFICVSYYGAYQSRMLDYLRGLLLAAAVLCNPFNIIIYAALLLTALLRRGESEKAYPGVRSILRIHGGIAVLAAAVLAYFLISMQIRGISLSDFADNFLFILSSDETGHLNVSAMTYIQNKLGFITLFHENFPLFLPLYLLTLAAGLIYKKAGKLCLRVVVLLTAAFCAYASLAMRNNYVLMFPAFLGLGVFVLDRSNLKGKSFLPWLIALLFALSVNLSSDNKLDAVSWAMIPCGILSILLLCESVENEPKSTGETKLGSFIRAHLFEAVCMALIALLAFHTTYVFQDAGFSELDTRLERGPLSGIVTTAQRADYYNSALDVYESVELSENDRVLSYPTLAVDLLILKRECCSPSAWYFPAPEDFNEGRYYSRHPDKLPTVVFVNNDMTQKVSYWEFSEWLEENYSVDSQAGSYTVFRKQP